MDFIERVFGVSPDGGNGSLELVYITAAVVIVVGAYLFWKQQKNLADPR